MIKISDFSARFGISPRHARRLLAEHEADLVGHYERNTKGTWIDEYAADYLRDLLRNPTEILPIEVVPDLEKLQAQNKALNDNLMAAYKLLAEERDVAYKERLRLTEKVSELKEDLANLRLLADGRAEVEQRAADLEAALVDSRKAVELTEEKSKELEERNQTLKDILEDLSQEKERNEKKQAAQIEDLRRELDNVGRFSIVDFLRFRKAKKRAKAATLVAMDDAENDRDLQGPFENVQDLMSALDAEETDKIQ